MDVQAFLDLQYKRRTASLSCERAISGALPLAEWKDMVRDALLRSLGLFPDELPSLSVRYLETIDMPGVCMRKITYVSEEGLVTPAYYLRPEGAQGKLPAVLAITGHGYGHRDCVGLKADGTVDEAGGYTKKFALNLCKRGFAVLAPEPLGFGDLRLDESKMISPETSSCQRIASNLIMMGRTLGGVRVLQSMRALDVMRELGDEIDLDRVGMMGISGGGLVTAFTTALDPRIRACVVSGYANTFEDSIMAMHHCVDNFFPGLARDVELPDILASIAPRPMLWEAGSEDPIFPGYGVDRAFAQVKAIYARENAAAAFDVDRFTGGHQISGAKAYDFLWDALAKI